MQKSFIGFLFCALFLYYSIKAQSTQEGLYLSYNDFITGKISFQKEPGKKYKLKLNNLFNTSLVFVTMGNSKFNLKKDSIFGYCDKNTSYRFYKNLNYKILNPTESVLLYSYSSLGGNKNTEVITTYFFSIEPTCPVIKLSKQNLKIAFIENGIFIDLLDTYFHNDDELLNYDKGHDIYLLNRIYQLSTISNFEKEKQP
ncbi:MAG: hypothetical protein ABIP51_14345 [Bacteroidia bacterium]